LRTTEIGTCKVIILLAVMFVFRNIFTGTLRIGDARKKFRKADLSRTEIRGKVLVVV
jgi:hypothetical protein